MNRARYAFAATFVGALAISALLAQETKAPETKAPEFKSVLQGKKFTPPLRGAAEVDFLRSATQRQGNLLVTKIQVKNMSLAPIPRLTIDEVWYDKNNEIIPGGKGVVQGLLQPGEIQTVEIRTPSNPAMTRSMLQFSHANGTVPKPHAVTSFAAPKDSKEPATKSAAATKKAAPAKKK
jgi:hypothetical protein